MGVKLDALRADAEVEMEIPRGADERVIRVEAKGVDVAERAETGGDEEAGAGDRRCWTRTGGVNDAGRGGGGMLADAEIIGAAAGLVCPSEFSIRIRLRGLGKSSMVPSACPSSIDASTANG
jgi:hypothetical protein